MKKTIKGGWLIILVIGISLFPLYNDSKKECERVGSYNMEKKIKQQK